MTYDDITAKIRNGEPFTFARWGDGEWNAVFVGTRWQEIVKKGPHQGNCDRHLYFEDLGEALREVLHSKPAYLMGIQGMTMRSEKLWPCVKEFLKENRLEFDWINSDMFHHASIKGRLGSFFEALSGREVIIIGPSFLSGLCNKLKAKLIEIPEINCWLSYKDIKNTLQKEVDLKDRAIYLFCASMMAEVLINDVHNEWNTFIDIGSLLDPYAGKNTRSYHYSLKI